MGDPSRKAKLYCRSSLQAKVAAGEIATNPSKKASGIQDRPPSDYVPPLSSPTLPQSSSSKRKNTPAPDLSTTKKSNSAESASLAIVPYGVSFVSMKQKGIGEIPSSLLF